MSEYLEICLFGELALYVILSRSFPKRLSFERADKKERRRPVFSKKERSVVRILLPSVFEARWCFCLREKTTFLRAFSLWFFFTKILLLFFVVTFVVIKKGVTTKTASSSSKERKKMSIEFKVSLKKTKDEKRERERGESDSLLYYLDSFFSFSS